MALECIGFWNEPPWVTDFIEPAALVSPGWAGEEKAALVSYLKGGTRYREAMGYSWCRLSDDVPDQEMGNAERSDGVWVWPEGLSVYVERFDVRLPEAFLQHARRQGFQAARPEPAGLSAKRVSMVFWRAWCAEQAGA